MLTKRWTPLKYHEIQLAYWNSKHRFNVIPAGRRGGKTERAKRKLVRCGIAGTKFDDAKFFAAAPTRDQAKKIWWKDLKNLVPPKLIAGRPLESELTIRLINGSEISVIGMDRPERIEGTPWDGGVMDEFANMKPEAWDENVRPALSDRAGWCDLIGVPEGRNHYYDINEFALTEMLIHGDKSEWGSFTWPSADILPAAEIESAKRQLDELTFMQEYEASFVNFQGLAYYSFNRNMHCARLEYNPDDDLIFMFDFNVSPGVAAIAQEQEGNVTGILGEVHIPRNSNTVRVCNKLIEDWGDHEGYIYIYGDATGGASGSAKVAGSDWALVNQTLTAHFGERIISKYGRSNPRERVRVNSVNSRLLNTAGDVSLKVDPSKAPHVVKDFEGVTLLLGGSGEIDKLKAPKLTHISDAIGYYIHSEFPIDGNTVIIDNY